MSLVLFALGSALRSLRLAPFLFPRLVGDREEDFGLRPTPTRSAIDPLIYPDDLGSLGSLTNLVNPDLSIQLRVGKIPTVAVKGEPILIESDPKWVGSVVGLSQGGGGWWLVSHSIAMLQLNIDTEKEKVIYFFNIVVRR